MKLSESLGLTEVGTAADSAEIVVLHTGPNLTPAAIEAAVHLTKGLSFHLVVIAVHVVPYPMQLSALSTVQEHLEAELQQAAETSSLPVMARIAFARDITAAFRQCIKPESLVVVGSRKRWWRTWEEKCARELARSGFRTALIHV